MTGIAVSAEIAVNKQMPPCTRWGARAVAVHVKPDDSGSLGEARAATTLPQVPDCWRGNRQYRRCQSDPPLIAVRQSE